MSLKWWQMGANITIAIKFEVEYRLSTAYLNLILAILKVNFAVGTVWRQIFWLSCLICFDQKSLFNHSQWRRILFPRSMFYYHCQCYDLHLQGQLDAGQAKLPKTLIYLIDCLTVTFAVVTQCSFLRWCNYCEVINIRETFFYGNQIAAVHNHWF